MHSTNLLEMRETHSCMAALRIVHRPPALKLTCYVGHKRDEILYVLTAEGGHRYTAVQRWCIDDSCLLLQEFSGIQLAKDEVSV